MKFNLNKLFSPEILERGKGYYSEGRVSNLLKNGNLITAAVQGSHKYKISINTKANTYRCNCPYEGRMCKHLAAVCYALSNRKNIPTVKSIETNLAKKSSTDISGWKRQARRRTGQAKRQFISGKSIDYILLVIFQQKSSQLLR